MDKQQQQQYQQPVLYNWIQFQQAYAEPKTDLITNDVTRAVLSKQGCNFIRRMTLLTNVLKEMGFYSSAKMVRDLAGAYAIATLGMGNYATLVAQSVYTARAFMFPEEQKEEDIISSITKNLKGFIKKRL